MGDFTQPAGRVHVDSRIDVPYLVEAAPAPKSYDSPVSNPIEAAGAGAAAADRFFIWASATTHRTCSIDTYSPLVQRRLKTPEATALDHARFAVLIDGVLYLKTHCHSMHPVYYKPDGLPTPHNDPAVKAELMALFDAAAKIGADVRFLTVSEVYDEIVGAPARSPRDLVQEFGLTAGSPMAPIGAAVDFLFADGTRAPPPPLGERPRSLPRPSLIDQAVLERRYASSNHHEPPVVAHILPLGGEAFLGAVEGFGKSMGGPLIDAAAVTADLMGARDVIRLNTVATARAGELGSEGSGITGFYGARAQEGTLLQPSEVLCAAAVQQWLPGARAAYEIGCGLGVLSSLLALRGISAVGIERNGARLATAEAIAEAALAESPVGARAPKLIRGAFPKGVRREKALAASVALVTNLLGSATLEQQTAFVVGLRAFGAVLIDAQRFYVRRTTDAQIAELLAMFVRAGFDQPRLAFDLGPDGQFLLFGNPSPKRRPGLEAVLARLGAVRGAPLFASG